MSVTITQSASPASRTGLGQSHEIALMATKMSLAAMTSFTTDGAAGRVASRPAVDRGLPPALADLTNAKKPLGGKRLRQRLHRLGRRRKIEDLMLAFKDIDIA